MLEYFMDGAAVRVPHATLSWAYLPGLFLPSDNLDAKASYLVALTDAGAVVPAGKPAVLDFTVAGGAPIVGQTVYAASSQDDGNTGRGKATATQPPAPPAFAAFPLFTQNQVPVGVVVSSTYGTNHRAVVTMAANIKPVSVAPPADTSVTLHGLKCPPGTRAAITPLTTSQIQLHDGESISVKFSLDTLVVAASSQFRGPLRWDTAVAVHAGLLARANGAGLSLYNAGDNAFNFNPKPGLNCVTITRTGGNARASLNGNPVLVVPDAGWETGVIYFEISYEFGSVYSIVKLARPMLDAEVMSTAGGAVQRSFNNPTPLSAYQPSPVLLADLTMQWYFDFTSTAAAATVTSTPGPGGVAFTLAVDPGAVFTARVLDWYQTPANLFIDGPAGSYDSRHLALTNAFQDVEYTVNNLEDVVFLCAGVAAMDNDNLDEDAVTMFVNGVPICLADTSTFHTGADGVTYQINPAWSTVGVGDAATFWRNAIGAVGPWTVRLVVSDQLRRIDTFGSGTFIMNLVIPHTAVFANDVTADRLVMHGEGSTLGGHSQDLINVSPASGAVVSRIRADFPGRVSYLFGAGQESVFSLKGWGNGSLVPAAKYVVTNSRGNVARTHFCMLGFVDYITAFQPVAAWRVDYQNYIAAIQAADPTATIEIAKLVQLAFAAVANGQGDTLADYNNAIVAIGAALGVAVKDVSGPTPIPMAGGGQLPAAPAGQIALHDNIKAALPY